MNQYRYIRFTSVGVLVMLMLALTLPETAHADGPQLCTNFADLNQQAASGQTGLVTNTTDYIKTVVSSTTRDLFQAFTSSSVYRGAVNAAITLMIIIYGVGFSIGVVQASFGQLLIRLVKIGMIYMLISPSGWDFFNSYAVRFFNDGTDEIIGKVMEIGTGVAFVDGKPFTVLDGLATRILSPDMMIAVLGAFFNGGPFAIGMGALLAFAVFGLIKLLIDGLKLYALSFVVRSLLLGVAPLFIVFMLFDKTKQLFTGWISLMVSLSLQPILYFTFLSFFLVMLSSAAQNMMGGAELCWSEKATGSGTANKLAFWRFKGKDNNWVVIDEFDWKGQLSCRTNPDPTKPCKEFPLNILDILSFLILVYVAQKFAGVTSTIAAEISNSYANLDTQGKMDISQMKGAATTDAPQSGGSGGGGSGNAGNAPPPAPTPRPGSRPGS